MKKSFDPKLILVALVAIVAVGAGVYFLAPGAEVGGKETQTAGVKPKDLEDNPNTPAGMGLDSGGSPSGESAAPGDPNAAAGDGGGQSAAAN